MAELNAGRITGAARVSGLVRLVEEARRAGFSSAEIKVLMGDYGQNQCDPAPSYADMRAVLNSLPEEQRRRLGLGSKPEPSGPAPAVSEGSGSARGWPIGGITGKGAAPVEELDIALFSSMIREPVSWLWPGRIPLGKVTVISGSTGSGKSLLTWDIAARVSRGGDWPGLGAEPAQKNCIPGRVLLLNAEDHLADAIWPGLRAAGADMNQVLGIRGLYSKVRRFEGSGRGIALLEHLPVLRRELQAAEDVRLVVIDPLDAYCGRIGRQATGRSRRVLAELSELAAEFNLALIVVAGERSTGLPARTAWTVERDPFDADLRLWTASQFHYGPLPDALRFRVRQGRLEWESSSVRLTAEDVAGGFRAACRGRMRVQVVADWLRRFLKPGPREATEVYEAGCMVGLSKGQLWRAQVRLGVTVTKQPVEDGKWMWQLEEVAGCQLPVVGSESSPEGGEGALASPTAAGEMG